MAVSQSFSAKRSSCLENSLYYSAIVFYPFIILLSTVFFPKIVLPVNGEDRHTDISLLNNFTSRSIIQELSDEEHVTILTVRFTGLLQSLYHTVIISRLMRVCTVGTVLYSSPVLLYIRRISRAVFPQIQRTVAKQTVKVLQSLMAGKIPAIPVFKKTV